jgi:deoxyribonuclease-1
MKGSALAILMIVAASPADDFQDAKRVLLNRIYAGHRTDFYCGCPFGTDKSVNAATCGYRIRRDAQRGSRIEWEHIVPAATFGQQFACWQNARGVCGRKGGRKCCEATDRTFRRLEADMHNLAPAVGELNGDRENFPFGEVPGEPRLYGACDFEVQNGVAEPRAAIRGEIARAHLYLNDRLTAEIGRGFMSREEALRFQSWNVQDPPDDWECERNARIYDVQGRDNPYVTRRCE